VNECQNWDYPFFETPTFSLTGYAGVITLPRYEAYYLTETVTGIVVELEFFFTKSGDIHDRQKHINNRQMIAELMKKFCEFRRESLTIH
jgi:hypothetical protein